MCTLDNLGSKQDCIEVLSFVVTALRLEAVALILCVSARRITGLQAAIFGLIGGGMGGLVWTGCSLMCESIISNTVLTVSTSRHQHLCHYITPSVMSAE